MARRLLFALISLAMFGGQAHADPSQSVDAVSFEREVMSVLSKAGCNSGTCHGNLRGKGGLKLSLRGQHPDADFRAIAIDLSGRRINRNEPSASLLLRKPTAEVAHQGGLRFRPGSLEHETIRRWIETGLAPPNLSRPPVSALSVYPKEAVLREPESTVTLRVVAHFADGEEQDVTRQAVYETSNFVASVNKSGVVTRKEFGESTIMIRYLQQQTSVPVAFVRSSPDFVWNEPFERNQIDRIVFRKLKRLRVQPAGRASDHEFLRRAYLDTLGLLPTAGDAKSFVNSSDPLKRDQLIEKLVSQPEFGELWAMRWGDLLRIEEKQLDLKGVDVFHRWVTQAFQSGKPLNQFCSELVSATGSTFENPPANYFRSHRTPQIRAESAAQVFLGRRLQCARCHDHPFDRWTQDDYYSWTALFARVGYELPKTARRDKLDKNEFVGDQKVVFEDKGEVKNPRTGKPAPPKLLGVNEEVATDERLARLADWLASSDNREFARAQANRIWYHLMGRGLVEPLDDFRVTNPASHPELLEWLTDELIRSSFDVKHITRLIMRSSTYQLSSSNNESNRDDERNYSRNVIRRLTAEQLLDAQGQILAVRANLNGFTPNQRAGTIPGTRRVRLRDEKRSTGDRFLETFGKPKRSLACECERSNETTLAQALLLVSGDGLNSMLNHSDNRLASFAAKQTPIQEVINELFWSSLSREPSDRELDACLRTIDLAASREEGIRDVAWALLNAKEFIFRY